MKSVPCVLLISSVLVLLISHFVSVSASNEEAVISDHSSGLLQRFVRAVRPPTPRNFVAQHRPKHRPRDQFQVKSTFEFGNDRALCNSKSNANMTRSGQTYAGSKGLAYSEDSGSDKSLICKSKSFKLTNKGGSLRRVAVGGTAILSNSPSIDKILSAQQTNTKFLEVGSIGKSAIGSNALKKEVAAAIESQGTNAGSSSVSKSKLLPHRLHTMSNVDGGTEMKGKKGLGMRGISKEATQLVKNPKGNTRGNRRGEFLTHLSHSRKSNFEIEI